MTEPFESPSFASGRIWGVARPRVRYTRADVERLVDETAARVPNLWRDAFFSLSGRTSYADANVFDARNRRTRFYRALAGRRVFVPRETHFETFDFAKVMNFGAPMLSSGVDLKAWRAAVASIQGPIILGDDPSDSAAPALAIARPNDWRETAIRRAVEGGFFNELPKAVLWRGPTEYATQRAVAEAVGALTGRTLHRKSWKAAAQFVWKALAVLKLGQTTEKVPIPRLRWADAIDARAAATGSAP